MTRWILLCAGALVGCGSSSSGSPPPTSCDPATDRLGTYLFHYDRIGGNCGQVDDQLVSLNPGPGAPVNSCVINSERITEGGCKIERDGTCRAPDGTLVRTVMSSRQETEDGSFLDGTATFTISGPVTCTGTYRVSGTRQ
jgi:hypothetical protein